MVLFCVLPWSFSLRLSGLGTSNSTLQPRIIKRFRCRVSDLLCRPGDIQAKEFLPKRRKLIPTLNPNTLTNPDLLQVLKGKKKLAMTAARAPACIRRLKVKTPDSQDPPMIL